MAQGLGAGDVAMQEAVFRGPRQSYRPLPAWRWLTFLPMGVILAAGSAVIFSFAGTERWWWGLAIMAIPTVVALFLTRDFSHVSLDLGENGLRYRAVGYVVEAPWTAVARAGKKNALVLDEPDIRLEGWLRAMAFGVVTLRPGRGRLAFAAMRVVPLELFDDGRLGKTLEGILTKRPSP